MNGLQFNGFYLAVYKNLRLLPNGYNNFISNKLVSFVIISHNDFSNRANHQYLFAEWLNR